jgi:hypothetical protein
MFEKRHEPLLPRRKFYLRLWRSIVTAGAIILFSLGIGVLGYHFCNKLSWLDSLLNASMILTGMGPVDSMRTVPSKLFASFYALFSGMVFLTAVGVLFAPVAHRLFHKFHLEVEPEDDRGERPKPKPNRNKSAS